MDTHSSSKTDSSGGFWPVANIVLGLLVALFAFYWGAVLVKGGITNSRKLRAPAVPEAAAPAAVAVTPNANLPVLEVTLKPDSVNPMAYDTKSISAKAGQKVKLTFNNTHPTPLPHNCVVGKVGTKDKMMPIAMSAITLADKGFIPDSPDILAHTKLIQPGQSETIEFTLPSAGEYPYFCTFPGHVMIMNGVIKAE